MKTICLQTPYFLVPSGPNRQVSLYVYVCIHTTPRKNKQHSHSQTAFQDSRHYVLHPAVTCSMICQYVINTPVKSNMSENQSMTNYPVCAAAITSINYPWLCTYTTSLTT